MCDCFGVDVHVITSTEHNWHLEYKPTPRVNGFCINKKVFISYISPVHYNSLVPKRERRTSGGGGGGVELVDTPSQRRATVSYNVDTK